MKGKSNEMIQAIIIYIAAIIYEWFGSKLAWLEMEWVCLSSSDIVEFWGILGGIVGFIVFSVVFAKMITKEEKKMMGKYEVFICKLSKFILYTGCIFFIMGFAS